jgi:biopolymer transport protein ExbD
MRTRTGFVVLIGTLLGAGLVILLSHHVVHNVHTVPTMVPVVALPVGLHAKRTYDASDPETLVVSLTADNTVVVGNHSNNLAATRVYLNNAFSSRKRPINNFVLRIPATAKVGEVYAFINEIAEFIPESILFAVKSTSGWERVYEYGQPLLDGYRRFPWYKIVNPHDPSPFEEQLGRVKTSEKLPGYARLTVLVTVSGFRTLGKDLTEGEFLSLLKELATQYRVLAVVFAVDAEYSYQRLIDCCDVCKRAGLPSYIFFLSRDGTGGNRGQLRTLDNSDEK